MPRKALDALSEIKVVSDLVSCFAACLPDDRLHRRKGILYTVVQLGDEHLGPNFILLMFGKISKRSKILNNITARIAN